MLGRFGAVLIRVLRTNGIEINIINRIRINRKKESEKQRDREDEEEREGGRKASQPMV